jgi:hypothetical protein
MERPTGLNNWSGSGEDAALRTMRVFYFWLYGYGWNLLGRYATRLSFLNKMCAEKAAMHQFKRCLHR